MVSDTQKTLTWLHSFAMRLSCLSSVSFKAIAFTSRSSSRNFVCSDRRAASDFTASDKNLTWARAAATCHHAVSYASDTIVVI